MTPSKGNNCWCKQKCLFWSLAVTTGFPTFPETDGLRTNSLFPRPARDLTNSNRLDGSALTWLPSPACSVRWTSHFIVCTAVFSFYCLVDSPGILPCAQLLHVPVSLEASVMTCHPSLCSPQATASNSYTACQSLPQFFTGSWGFRLESDLVQQSLNGSQLANETHCHWNYCSYI